MPQMAAIPKPRLRSGARSMVFHRDVSDTEAIERAAVQVKCRDLQ